MDTRKQIAALFPQGIDGHRPGTTYRVPVNGYTLSIIWGEHAYAGPDEVEVGVFAENGGSLMCWPHDDTVEGNVPPSARRKRKRSVGRVRSSCRASRRDSGRASGSGAA